MIVSVTVPLPVILIYGDDGKNSALYKEPPAVNTTGLCPSNEYLNGLQLNESESAPVSRSSCSMSASSL